MDGEKGDSIARLCCRVLISTVSQRRFLYVVIYVSRGCWISFDGKVIGIVFVLKTQVKSFYIDRCA